jgi:uncharacterized cupin superfamily protein
VVEEARLEQLEAGLTPISDGWFVVNVRDGAWVRSDAFGDAGILEGEEEARFADVGFTLHVLRPGKPNGMYHSETNQEDFLVLAGECLLLVEGEERRLGAWDFVHCPPGTDHIFVGAGDGPCVIFMTGGRAREERIVYPRSELARRHGAGVEKETTEPAEAYASFPKWQLGPPADWAGLPWA